MATVTNKKGEYIDFLSTYGYDTQLACYQEIVYQNTGEKLPCFICAVTKETPINSIIIKIPQWVMDTCLFQVKSLLPSFYEVKMGLREPIRCEKCNYCIETRKETKIITMEDLV